MAEHCVPVLWLHLPFRLCCFLRQSLYVTQAGLNALDPLASTSGVLGLQSGGENENGKREFKKENMFGICN